MRQLTFASQTFALTALVLSVGFAVSHCGNVVTGIETDPTMVDPFPSRGDGAVVVIQPDGAVDAGGLSDASPFEGLDGRVRRDDPRYGRLFYSRTVDEQGNVNAVLGATFWRLERMPRCTTYSDGPFSFSDCAQGQMDPDQEQIPRAHSGTINVSSRGIPPELLLPNRRGEYPDNSVNRDNFGMPRDQLMFRSEGAEVPAFMATVAVPARPVFRMTAPAGTEITVGREVSIAWNSSAGQFAYVLIQENYTQNGEGRTASVAAYVHSRDGQVTFPARVTRRLHAAPDATGFIYVAAINTVDIDAGLWPIQLDTYVGEFSQITVR